MEKENKELKTKLKITNRKRKAGRPSAFGDKEIRNRWIKIWFSHCCLKLSYLEIQEKYGFSLSSIKKSIEFIQKNFAKVQSKDLLSNAIVCLEERIKDLSSLLKSNSSQPILTIGELSKRYSKDLLKLQNLYRENFELEKKYPEIINPNLKEFQEWLKWRNTELNTQERKDQDGYIYLLKSQNAYKIGRSQSIEKRIYTIQNTTPFKIKLIFKKKVRDCFQMERKLHLKFKEKRIKGEWFQLNKEDIEEIKEMLYSESSQYIQKCKKMGILKFKFCSKCKEKKRLFKFGKNKHNKDGYINRCKKCDIKYKEQQQKHCEKYVEQYVEQYELDVKRLFNLF